MPTIREIRVSQGLTRQDLSNKAHISTATIARLENDGVASRNTILRLCEVLGVQVDDVSGVTYSVKDVAR